MRSKVDSDYFSKLIELKNRMKENEKRYRTVGMKQKEMNQLLAEIEIEIIHTGILRRRIKVDPITLEITSNIVFPHEIQAGDKIETFYWAQWRSEESIFIFYVSPASGRSTPVRKKAWTLEGISTNSTLDEFNAKIGINLARFHSYRDFLLTLIKGFSLAEKECKKVGVEK